MKDNIDLLFDALEHPENYSDAEVELLLTDPKAREVYDMLRKTTDVSAFVPEINLDEEWRHFEAQRLQSSPVILRWLRFVVSRNVAAIVLALVGAVAVVAATIGVTHYFNVQKEIAQAEQVVSQEQAAIAHANVAQTDTIPAEETPLPETIVFKGENIERILADIAGYYGATVKFNQDATKSLQLYFEWDRSLPLSEVVEQLNNFEQINITYTNKALTVE